MAGFFHVRVTVKTDDGKSKSYQDGSHFRDKERFLRILPGVQAPKKDTLPNLLAKATSAERKILVFSSKNRKDAIRRIKDVRNTILHGNFEEAAKQAKAGSVANFFKTQFAAEVETLYQITENLVRQIHPATGYPNKNQ
jgi:hypothetical protein